MAKNRRHGEERLQEMIRGFRAPCLLCRGPQAGTGVFIPNAESSRRMDVPLNRQRFCLYALCEDCLAMPEGMRETMVDQALIQPKPPTLDLGTKAPIRQRDMN